MKHIKSIGVIRQQFAQCVFNSKVQRNMCVQLSSKSSLSKKGNIVVSGVLTTVLLILQVQTDNNQYVGIFGLILTCLQLCYFIFTLSYDFGSEASTHRESSHQYRALRDKYQHLLSDCLDNNLSVKELKSQMSVYLKEYSMISNHAPDTNSKAYKDAQTQLGTADLPDQGHYHWTDAEIDLFLPTELKSTNN